MSSFQLAEVSSDVLRDEHYVTDENNEDARSTKLEAARISSILHSEDFSDAAWSKFNGASVTADDAVAPDGTTTADKVEGDGTTDPVVEQSFTVSDDGLARTASAIVKKKGSSDTVRLRVEYRGGTKVSAIMDVDVSDGSITQTGSEDRAIVEDYNSDWWRISLVASNNNSGNTSLFVSIFVDESGDGTGFQHLWGAQLEGVSGGAAFPSSYISTGSSAVSRAADDLTFPISFGPQALSMYAKFIDLTGGGYNKDPRIAGIGKSVGGDGVAFTLDPVGNKGYQAVLRDDSDSFNTTGAVGSAPSVGDVVEMLGVWDRQNGQLWCSVSQNGGTVATSSQVGDGTGGDSFRDNKVYIVRKGGETPEYFADYISGPRIASGVRTMEEMRTEGAGDLFEYNPGDDPGTFSRNSVATFRQATALDQGTSSPIKGNAGFKYTDADTGATVTYTLNFPLIIDAEHGVRKVRSALSSLDYSVRDVVTAPGKADEYEATIRVADKPQELLEMLRDAQESSKLEYWTDLNDSTTKRDTWLIGNENTIELEPETERGRAEWQIRIRLRGVSDGAFNDLV